MTQLQLLLRTDLLPQKHNKQIQTHIQKEIQIIQQPQQAQTHKLEQQHKQQQHHTLKLTNHSNKKNLSLHF